jgi:hypothetical protein
MRQTATSVLKDFPKKRDLQLTETNLLQSDVQKQEAIKEQKNILYYVLTHSHKEYCRTGHWHI